MKIEIIFTLELGSIKINTIEKKTKYDIHVKNQQSLKNKAYREVKTPKSKKPQSQFHLIQLKCPKTG